MFKLKSTLAGLFSPSNPVLLSYLRLRPLNYFVEQKGPSIKNCIGIIKGTDDFYFNDLSEFKNYIIL